MKKFLPFIVLLLCSLAVSAQYQRRVLIEEFTNASCPPCASQNPAFNTLLDSKADKITPIKYQTNWPGVDPMNAQNPSDVQTRVTYYAVSGVPNAFMDGTGVTNDCAYYPNAPACLNGAEIDARAGITSPVEVVATYSFTTDFDSLLISVSVTSATDLTGALRLHVAVVEEEIVFDAAPGTNGEEDFYQVMRKMLPNGNGTTTGDFTMGQTKTYTFGWPLANAYDINKLGVSAWLQHNTTKAIYNSARALPIGGALPANVKTVNSMNPYICVSGTTPTFTLVNTGTSDLTSATLRYKIGTGAWNIFNWTGNLAPGASEVVTLTGVSITTAGVTKIEVRVVNSNNGIQTNLVEAVIMDLKGLLNPAATLPFSQDFQTGSFPTAGGWSVFNFGTNGWKKVTNAGGSGSTSSVQNNMYAYDNANTTMTSQKLDLSSAAGVSELQFDYAYTWFDASFFDSLRINISTDCGVTWTTVFHDGYEGLATAPPTADQSAFTPVAADWKFKALDISAFNGNPEVLVSFVAESGYGNNLYLDNIRVATSVGVKALELEELSLQPNPSRGIAEVRFNLTTAQNVKMMVYDVVGGLVQSKNLGQLATGDHRIELDGTRLSAGSYRVVLQGAEGIAQKQWIVVK